MLRTRILLFLSASILVIIMFNLPKVVVENDRDGLSATETTSGESTSEPSADQHVPELSTEDQTKALTLKEKLRVAENKEKSIIFADSLVVLYLKVNKYDSAAKFIEIIAENNPTTENFRRAGDIFYEAYGFAMDAKKQALMGTQAQKYFSKVLETSPDDLEIKNKLAMTYLSTPNPMKGIMMLRDILEKDPANESAMFNLGVLSMQSGQYDLAVERFTQLVEINPGNTQAQFFLGVSFLEIGQKESARKQFEIVKSLDKDPSVQATVDAYLEEIK